MKHIKLIVFDFDGVFSDGKIMFDGSGNAIKHYNAKDGMGIKMLHKRGIQVASISGWKQNVSQMSIMQHLSIKRVSLGSNDKLNIVTEWCKELDIQLKEVAFIGDDINDLEIIKSVGLVGCPNNAIQDVKDLSNYVCKHKSGDGAIREFVEWILESEQSEDVDMLRCLKRQLNIGIDNLDMIEVDNMVEKIKACNGNVICLGVGKSGNMAKQFSDLLKSISIRIFHISVQDLLHGDIGVIDERDIVIMFSSSGNTSELLDKISYIKQRKAYTIGVCNRQASILHDNCDMMISLPYVNEMNGIIDKIPTNSVVMQLIFSNLVVSKLKENITLYQYQNNHPRGSIGNSLLKVRDVMRDEINTYTVKNGSDIDVIKVLISMTDKKVGYCCCIDDDGKMVGIITDGDLRRYRISNPQSIVMKNEEINCNFYYECDLNKYVNNLQRIQYIPILDTDKMLRGIVIR